MKESLLRSLMRARAEAVSERNRLRTLVGGGYSDRTFSEPLHEQSKSAQDDIDNLNFIIGMIDEAEEDDI